MMLNPASSGGRTPLGRFKELFLARQQEEAAPDPRRLALATCVVLLEIAQADDEFNEAERRHIRDTLAERFELGPAETEELIATSQTQRDQSADLWRFTHAINDQCSREEKFRIMEEVWRVIYADGVLDAHEDYLVHKLAKLLNLSHPELIKAKLTVINEQG